MDSYDPTRVIPQGPTVQATPASTNSLADIAALVIPALVGSQIRTASGQRAGMLGALAGAGEGQQALQDQRVTAQKFAEAEADQRYHQTLMDHAQAETEHMGLEAKELRRKIANRDEYADTIKDPNEKELFLLDPESWTKQEMRKKSAPGMIDFIVTASEGKLNKSQLQVLPPEALAKVFDDASSTVMAGGGKWQIIQTPAKTFDPSLEGQEEGERSVWAKVTSKGLLPVDGPDGKPMQAVKADKPKPYLEPKAATELRNDVELAHTLDDALKIATKAYGKDGPSWMQRVSALAETMGSDPVSEAAKAAVRDPDIRQLSQVSSAASAKLFKVQAGTAVSSAEEARVLKQLANLRTFATDPNAYMDALRTWREIQLREAKAKVEDIKGTRRLSPNLEKDVALLGGESPTTELPGPMADAKPNLADDSNALRKQFGLKAKYASVEDFKKAHPGLELEPVE